MEINSPYVQIILAIVQLHNVEMVVVEQTCLLSAGNHKIQVIPFGQGHLKDEKYHDTVTIYTACEVKLGWRASYMSPKGVVRYHYMHYTKPDITFDLQVICPWFIP